MPSYLAPGVYVEEVPGGARPISAADTSTAAFFGTAPLPDAPVREPAFLTSLGAFEQQFVQDAAAGTHLSRAVAGFFQNGGSRLYVVNLGQGATSVTAGDLALLSGIENISLVAAPGFTDAESVEAILADCEGRNDRFAVLDMAEGGDIPDLARAQGDGGLRPRGSDRGVAAVYTPWLEVVDAPSGARVACPPSGHICGLYAASDTTRGVWTAPANLSIRGALGLTRHISDAGQGVLNPVGVNCIRQFPDGIRVWGARTLGDPSGDWRYIAVRRLTTMIAQSIARGTRWVVFEPNDQALWASLRRDIDAFLHGLWRDGALVGATPEQAYVLRCGTDTMTQADIDEGRVIAIIGIAPVKPAEFVMVRICQSAGRPCLEEEM
jgi:phage tail sheath protein FI